MSMDEGRGFGTGIEFIWACRNAQTHFDAWADTFREEEIKENFRMLAEIRQHLESAIQKTQILLREGSA